MTTTRRQFIGAAAGGITVALGAAAFDKPSLAEAAQRIPGATGERVAAMTAPKFRPYRSKNSTVVDATTWVQVDLGEVKSFDAVKLYPTSEPAIGGAGFPLRFRIEASDDAAFSTRSLIFDHTQADFPNPNDLVLQFPARKSPGRFVRLTATRLGGERLHPGFGETMPESLTAAAGKQRGYLSLAKLEVVSKGEDLAQGRPVTVDEALGNPKRANRLTRAPRPNGEGIITDNPRNVTAAKTWRPVPYRAEAPRAGVKVQGLFKTALQNNVRYLLDSFTVEELLRPFRQRAGEPAGNSKPRPTQFAYFWEESLAGSNAGRFLMGAGNTLRWTEDAELRRRMNEVVDGIAKCRQANGYIMAYPENMIFDSEKGAYTRAWVTHGLIEAGYAGNDKAFGLLRSHYDWYNKAPYLPQVLRRCSFGPQGTVANTRMYFTPVGKAQDLQVVQRYMQEDYWLDQLIARNPDAIWQYPYDRPHSYVVTFLEPYLDLYRATGEQRYLEAARGGWELFRDNWQNVGGSLSIIEGPECPPKSNSLYEPLGETCGNAFWTVLSQRFHLLNPDDEQYVAEIEKSIYNVLLANQVGGEGIRYHSMLVGQKSIPQANNTCCEGQGTRLLGSLPEFIYSIAADGVYVNLFEASALDWEHAGRKVRLQMQTRFPQDTEVRLSLQTQQPVQMKLRVRVPSWAASDVELAVNGEAAGMGKPGSYVTLDRSWADGDMIAFTLPMELKMTKYTGVDQVQGQERYALQYGPLLMAAINGADTQLQLREAESPFELLQKLKPVKGQPLHFKFEALFQEIIWVPYYEVGAEPFSCFPVIGLREM